MTDADDMVDIAESKLEQLVGQDAGSIGEAKQTVISEDSAQTHGTGMQDGLMAQAAQTGMAMNDLDLLTDDNVAKDGEEGEDGGEGSLAIDNKEGYVIDLEAVGQVADASATLVLMGDDDDLVTTVNELLRQLVDMTLDSSRLWKEEVADHGDVVRHDGGRIVVLCAGSHD